MMRPYRQTNRAKMKVVVQPSRLILRNRISTVKVIIFTCIINTKVYKPLSL